MKTCGDCKFEKPLSEFNRKGDGYQSRCRECQRAWYKNYYDSSPKEKSRLLEKNDLIRNQIREFTRQARSVPCADCKKVYPYYVMDFDHLDRSTKEFDVARMLNCGSLEKVKAEVAKCEVVCSNCHRIRTFNTVWSVGSPL